MGLISSFKESFNTRQVKKVDKIADTVLIREKEMAELSDEQLRAKTDEFKKRFFAGETLDELLPEAFAVCREGAVRALGMKHFKVQVTGGISLHQGRISEMKTGEGKTLACTLPAYLNALTGKGVHIVTVNDYLAKRDMEWMGKLYTFLGLSVGCVIHNMSSEEKQIAYNSDITYGTNNEFGFDYLRDNMAVYKEDLMQRELNYAIVDEVDSILIDEARTPLIISGEGDESTDLYRKADKFVQTLKRGKKKSDEQKVVLENLSFDEEQEKTGDFLVDEKDKTVTLTESGVEKSENYFDVENFSNPENMELNHHVIQALKARNLMEKDIDYVVKDGEIIIVDEFTGRLMEGRRYSDGLHQAIEAKEGITIQKESKTLATITIQNYFRMYQKLAGMTGTAKTEEEEFTEIYNMDVIQIPTNKPMIRDDKNDIIYKTEKTKFNAIVDAIEKIHKTGQPLLVGTISIEKSEILSDILNRRGIKHNVLNAKKHEQEAMIIAQAGRKNQVTIATNMAGRGTDIVLGGNPDYEAKELLKKDGFTDEEISIISSFVPLENNELKEARKTYNENLNALRTELLPEQKDVISLGGLYIIGTERHESRRIDNQLRGRSGRQGDPGTTQFFISMEDELLRLFGGERMSALVERLGVEEGESFEIGMLSRSIENAQKKVESRNFQARKYVLQYDNVMNKQREAVYKDRKKVLHGENLRESIVKMTEATISDIVLSETASYKYAGEWDFERLNEKLKDLSHAFKGIQIDSYDIDNLTADKLIYDLTKEFIDIYENKELEIPEEHMRELERMILLQVTDTKWTEHIDAMDQLKTGISLRSFGQVDPARAYAEEGFEMFRELTKAIRDETVKYCFNVEPESSTERKKVTHNEIEIKAEDFDDDILEPININKRAETKENYDEEVKAVPYKRIEKKVGRNDPCPCGSGKKYKNCHGKNN
ncbi:MAG: preprotein translocase subunit SecA [Clostridiales Family XIII bacterium]|jgi:preprotein translocase subunit SecA|nr:preprotein translocase subunit SecA [Clostridiales Family XIII bacterium]